jgi:hypothetical protein
VIFIRQRGHGHGGGQIARTITDPDQQTKALWNVALAAASRDPGSAEQTGVAE